MKYSDLKKELKYLKIEKIKSLKVINSMYFVNSQVRNEQFKKIKLLENEISKIEFKIKLLKEKEKIENNNTY